MAKIHMRSSEGPSLCGMRIISRRLTDEPENVTCKLCLGIMHTESVEPEQTEPVTMHEDKDRDWDDLDTTHGTLEGAIICNTRIPDVKTSEWLEEVTCRSCRQHSYFKSMPMMPDEIARKKGLRNTN